MHFKLVTFSTLILSFSLASCGTSTPSGVFNVIWKNWDGTTLLNESYNYGNVPSYKLELPKKDSDDQHEYVFDKWEPEIIPATSDAVYTAAFKPVNNKYDITWKMDDGTTLRVDKVTYGEIPDYGGEPKKDPPDKSHSYKFVKWSPNIVPVKGPTEYTACFELIDNVYDITWKMDDGTTLRVDKVTYGDTPSYGSDPTKDPEDGYSFLFNSWSPKIVPVEGPKTYTAQFDKYKTDPAVIFSFELSNFFDGSITIKCTGDVEMVGWDGKLSHELEKNFKTEYYTESHTCKVYGTNITGISVRYSKNYDYCSANFTALILSDQISEIPYRAFYDNHNSGIFSPSLSSIRIPNSVTSIGDEAFYHQPLSEVIFGEESQLTSIGLSAFSGCSSLTSINIPSSVTEIGFSAFSSCSNLKTVTFEEGVKEIESYAFYRCYGLESVVIPKGVDIINSNAFETGSTNLTIYCEDESKPAGWDDDWTDCENIVWNYKPNDINV